MKIPLEIFRYLDKGKNPERFVKDSLEQCFTMNQKTHAKVTVLDALRDQLSHDFEALYPEQYDAFVQQAGATSAADAAEARPPQEPPLLVPQAQQARLQPPRSATAAAAGGTSSSSEEEVVSVIKRQRTAPVDVVPDEDSMI